jgi:diketogulonate reductase-like aldo/keto reductase
MGGSEKALAGGSYALKSGIHHIDTAQIYGTEKEAGQAIQKAGLNREEVYITTKRESTYLVRMSRLRPVFNMPSRCSTGSANKGSPL